MKIKRFECEEDPAVHYGKNPDQMGCIEWIGIALEGPWAIPIEDVNLIKGTIRWSKKAWLQNYDKLGKDKLIDLQDEYRYLEWRWLKEPTMSLKDYKRRIYLNKLMGVKTGNLNMFNLAYTYSKWVPTMVEVLSNGGRMRDVTRAIKCKHETLIKTLAKLPELQEMADLAEHEYKMKMIDNLNKLAIEGNNESARARSTMFILERRFPNDFGKVDTIQFGKEKSPLTELLDRINDEDPWNLNTTTDEDKEE